MNGSLASISFLQSHKRVTKTSDAVCLIFQKEKYFFERQTIWLMKCNCQYLDSITSWSTARYLFQSSNMDIGLKYSRLEIFSVLFTFLFDACISKGVTATSSAAHGAANNRRKLCNSSGCEGKYSLDYRNL